MTEAALAFVCVVAIVGMVAVVGIVSKQWIRAKAGRTGVDIESRPTERDAAASDAATTFVAGDGQSFIPDRPKPKPAKKKASERASRKK